jgi:hypothetical protein
MIPLFFNSLLNCSIGRLSWRVALASWLFYYVLENIFLLLGLNGKRKEGESELYHVFNKVKLAPDPMARSVNMLLFFSLFITLKETS